MTIREIEEQPLEASAQQEVVTLEEDAGDHEGHDHEEEGSDHEGHNHSEESEEIAWDDGNGEKVKAPKIITKTLDGNTINLADYKGKRVVLNFWATYCPPCKEEMPQLQHYFEESAEAQNAVILGVNLTDQDIGMKAIKKFVNEYEVTFPILLDEKGEISSNYGVITIPSTIIVNGEGYIETQIVGPVTEELLIHKLGELDDANKGS